MADSFALPVSVVLDRADQGPLDLVPMLEPGSLSWSSVVPGGFASCSFQVNGDFRRLWQLIPYLSIVRVIGDSGKVLFEGQIEDKQPTLSADTVGVKVVAFGLQNALKEQSVRASWSKRDLTWQEMAGAVGSTMFSTVTLGPSENFQVSIGQVDPTNPSLQGVQIGAVGNSITTLTGTAVDALLPGVATDTPTLLTWQRFMCDFTYNGTVSLSGFDASSADGSTWTATLSTTTRSINRALVANANRVRLGMENGGSTAVVPATNWGRWTNIRLLGTAVTEDVAGGFFGDTLIGSLISTYVPALGLGVIESGSDFTIDHLDASVRRSAYDILQEIAQYYSREWAVWENALLDWRTPNLQQNQWVIPIAKLTGMDLDSSTVNSQRGVIVQFTDAASGVTGEQSAVTADQRNPYVRNGRVKDLIHADNLTMTANTAAQFANRILNDLGFGPVPASGTIVLPGETIVDHATGRSLKAWEIRAGENVTIPELPMADVFTQDGRGEVLFHIVSAEASESEGTVTLTLDSYGSKRSDVLLARLAAVTNLLGG